ncbi:type IV pilus biogenesis protein PilM [Geomesophilobacter sediminis]|uniref:Type IV pilus assembly protein PilM n=1 Tax=Geomesophilobacter sediminis TaxID=2798584 RepID=A0A8J7S897_9BACT|nr:type IV pilus assembly protein PilM [Geomesophilobacter sediminis]MBJ6727447.1 type IV pilus assembly protein PilM [Geomesophilobacter sediminis]
MLFLRKKDVVGIDIGSSAVKLVQLRESKGGYQLLNVGILPLPGEAIVDNTLMDTPSIVATVKGLVESLGVRAKDAVCSISGNAVIIRKISLPLMGAEELEDQIHWEAEQYIPFDINDVNVDFEILSPDEQDPSKMNVLLVASKKEIINDYLSVFAEAGLKLVVVDVDSFAVQNAFETNYEPDPAEVVALVNVGASIMNLNIVKGGVSLFTRDVQMGGNLYTEEIQKQFALNREEAEHLKLTAANSNDERLVGVFQRVNDSLAQEMRRSLEFYNSTAGEERIAKVYLSGGTAKAALLVETVQQKLALPVEILNPFHKVTANEKDFDPDYLREIGPLVAVATGLATRRAGDK